MQLVMLSGNSRRNQTWIYEARNELGHLFDSTYVQDYGHWHTGAEWINLDYELAVLQQNTASFSKSYAVFAKSIGTVLATQALAREFIQPRFMLFLGIPLGYIKDSYPQFREVLADNKVPLTIIHNDQDTVGSAAEVKALLDEKLAERGDYNFITTPGDTHDYEDFSLIAEELGRLKELS